MSYARVSIKVKAKKEENRKPKKTSGAQNKRSAEAAVTVSSSNELQERRWSVVTFENCAARNLTYQEAFEKLKALEAEKIAGLCVVTDEAAERILRREK